MVQNTHHIIYNAYTSLLPLLHYTTISKDV